SGLGGRFPITPSPDGATHRTRRQVCHPVGALADGEAYQGLTPLAIVGRPVGATRPGHPIPASHTHRLRTLAICWPARARHRAPAGATGWLGCPAGHSIVHSASDSRSFTNTRLPSMIGSAQVGVSATLYFANCSKPSLLGLNAMSSEVLLR